MRRIAGLCMAAAVLALAAGCGKKGGDTGGGGGVPSIEGTYLIVGVEMEGKPLPEEFFAKAPEAERTMKITADKMILTKGGKEDPMAYKVDTSKTPYEIDMTSKKGGKDEKTYGIYKVEGDKLIVCAVESDKPADRPKEFKTAPGSEAMMMTLKKK